MYICWIFQNIVGCQNNHLSRVKTKQNGMKKPKYLSLICWKEFVLKSGKTENHESRITNIGNVGKLFHPKNKLFEALQLRNTLIMY